MALHKGMRIHQYLDDSLVNVRSHQAYLQRTQTLVALLQELGWMVKMEKSELDPRHVFDFVGYQFDLNEGKVSPTIERLQALHSKIQKLLSKPYRKASSPSPAPHETNIVALEKQLADIRITRKGDPFLQVIPPTL